MFENQVSIRTKKLNILNEKVKPFRRQFSESLSRVQQKSSMHTLAMTTYSEKYNQQFSPKKVRTPSANNPELRMSTPGLKGLNMRLPHMPNLSDINTQLLREKAQLEKRIEFLNEEIAKETRLKNRAETNWKMNANNNSYSNKAYEQLCKKSQKLNDNINEVKAENVQLNREINQLRQANAEKRNNINLEDNNVKRMTRQVNTLKANLMQQEKQRNFVKGELMKQQKVMDSFSIESKQLENERAMVLLEINNSVLKNKI